MRFVVHTPRLSNDKPLVPDEVIRGDNDGNVSLGAMFKGRAECVDKVLVNNVPFPEWQLFVPRENDNIDVYVVPGIEGIGAFLISTLISFALSFIMQLLMPQPNKPSQKRAQPAFGVAGISNTIAPGTVKFLVYGKRRVFGFLVASRVDISKRRRAKLFRKMSFTVVYFMGAGPIKHIVAPKLGDGGTKYEDFPGEFAYDVRLGTEDQTIFPKHENVHQTYSINKPIPIPSKDEEDANEPIVETTRGLVDKVTIFFSFPNGIFAVNQTTGELTNGHYDFAIDYKKNSNTTWITGLKERYQAKTKDGLFAAYELEFDEKDRYDIRIQCTHIKKKTHGSGPATWLNLMETQFITTAYPGNSLMEVSGIGSEQFQSIENLKISGLVCGRIIPVWDEASQMIIRDWTNSRAWICRDILTDPKHCLGSTFSEDGVDDGSLVQASTNWELDQVEGYNGTEDRDHCDVIVGAQDGAQPGWDLLKKLTFEGDTRFLPIRGKLTYVIDRGGEPVRDYSDPGFIREGTVTSEFGRNEKAANTMITTFADELQDYREVPAKLVRRAGLGNDYERAEDAAYMSITRESQVARRMRHDIEKIDLVDRFWDWECDYAAMRSYPTQVLRLSYRTRHDRRGVSVFVAAGSTSTTIQLDRLVTLASGETYTAYLLHKLNDQLEKKTIVTPAGTWREIVVTSAFTGTIKVGDILIIGIETEQVNKVVLDAVERDGNGIYKLKTSIYVPEVYQIDSPLPSVTDFINASPTTQAPQQPIRAQVIGNTGAGRAEFSVAPGFNHYHGTSTATTATYIDLANAEPNVDDFFNGYTIEVGTNSAKIIDYVGSTRRATLDADLGVTGAQDYRLISPAAGIFNGYSVYSSSSPTGPFTTFVGSTLTTQLNASGLQASTDYFQITPISAQGVENTIGRWVIQIGAPTADVTAPDPPTSVEFKMVTNNATENEGTVEAVFDFPLDRDVWRVYVEVNEGSPSGTNRGTASLDISNQRDEDNDTGEGAISALLDFSSLAAGTELFARARVEDYFGNVSAWVDAPDAGEVSDDDLEDTLDDAGINATDVVVSNTTTETTVATAKIPGGGLGTKGLVWLSTLMKVTDNDATHDATITLRLKFKGTTIASMVIRTSDEMSNLGTDFCWKVVGYMAMKGTKTDALAVIERVGFSTVTDSPYPGMPVKIVRNINAGLNTNSSGNLILTVQLSMASTGLSVTKEYNWHEFVLD